MRVIKFRAWISGEGEMAPWEELVSDYYHMDEFIQPDGLIFMQYTGLLDKNDKEIYEGDIVRYIRYNWKCQGHSQDQTDMVSVCEIYWDEKRHAFREQGKFPSGGGWSGYLSFNDERADRNEIEVIGNIYENPELISSN